MWSPFIPIWEKAVEEAEIRKKIESLKNEIKVLEDKLQDTENIFTY